MRTLIHDATVIPIEPRGKVWQSGSVLIENGRIIDVGPGAEVQKRATAVDRFIDARGKIVLPGFVSAHNHLGYAVFRGRAEDFGIGAGRRLYLPMAAVLSREERVAIGTLAAAELLRGGCTTVFEMEEDADALACAISDVGLRASVAVMVNDVDLDQLATGRIRYSESRCESQLEQAVQFAEHHGDANGLITPALGANALTTSSPRQLRGLREAADRIGVRLSIHLGTGEAAFLDREYGAGSIDFARDQGLLAPDVIAVHGYKLSEDDITAFARTGAHLAHCPQVNAFRGHVAAAQVFLEQGINVGLGVDNFFSDCFDVMRACIAVARIRSRDPLALPALSVLELATLGGARAMGLESLIGSLEVGKHADLQIVDMRQYGLSPAHNPVDTLVYHAHAKDVEAVMVNGSFVVENGRVNGVDEDALVEAANAASTSAWSRFEARYPA